MDNVDSAIQIQVGQLLITCNNSSRDFVDNFASDNSRNSFLSVTDIAPSDSTCIGACHDCTKKEACNYYAIMKLRTKRCESCNDLGDCAACSNCTSCHYYNTTTDEKKTGIRYRTELKLGRNFNKNNSPAENDREHYVNVHAKCVALTRSGNSSIGSVFFCLARQKDSNEWKSFDVTSRCGSVAALKMNNCGSLPSCACCKVLNDYTSGISSETCSFLFTDNVTITNQPKSLSSFFTITLLEWYNDNTTSTLSDEYKRIAKLTSKHPVQRFFSCYRLSRAVLEAFRSCGRNTCFRDVKPDNIIVAVDENGQYSAKIIDCEHMRTSALNNGTKSSKVGTTVFWSLPYELVTMFDRTKQDISLLNADINKQFRSMYSDKYDSYAVGIIIAALFGKTENCESFIYNGCTGHVRDKRNDADVIDYITGIYNNNFNAADVDSMSRAVTNWIQYLYTGISNEVLPGIIVTDAKNALINLIFNLTTPDVSKRWSLHDDVTLSALDDVAGRLRSIVRLERHDTNTNMTIKATVPIHGNTSSAVFYHDSMLTRSPSWNEFECDSQDWSCKETVCNKKM